MLDKENAAGAHRRLHDRRLQGLHEGRPEEPAAQPGHPQDRRRLQQADRDRALLAHGAARRDRRPEERLQPQHPALHRLVRARGHPGPPRPPARRHPRPRPRRARALLGRLPEPARHAVQAEPARLQRPRDRRQRASSRPSSTRRVQEVRGRRRASKVDDWFAAHRARLGDRSPRHEAERPDRRARRRPARPVQAGAAARRVRRLRAAHDLLARAPCTTTSS